PGKVAEKHPAPMTQDTRCGDTGTTIQQRKRRQHEHPGQQVEAHQVEHDEADREEGCPQQRRPGLYGDGDGKYRRQRQDRARHEGADKGVADRHEQLGFAGVDHLGDEFGWDKVGHGWIPFLRGFQLAALPSPVAYNSTESPFRRAGHTLRVTSGCSIQVPSCSLKCCLYRGEATTSEPCTWPSKPRPMTLAPDCGSRLWMAWTCSPAAPCGRWNSATWAPANHTTTPEWGTRS